MKLQEVNVASGLAHEYRGILLSSAEDLSRLEARQTLLEGGVVTATAVRRIPDLRRGDAVRIEVISGDVHLSAPALALEPGVINQKIKVQTLKTKRELVGLLRSGGTVEVRL
jgi:flagella basal body P-ring formation protein FlgA